MKKTCVTALVLAATAGASADVITAKYTSSLGQQVNVTRNGSTSNVQTVKFNWQRTDAPGPGVDSSIGSPFNTYCVEITQSITANTPHTFTVLDPISAGFQAEQRRMFSRLWASFFSLIDTPTESAAFQLAIWEVVYDTGADVTAGNFRANSPSAAAVLAQSHLDAVTNPQYDGPHTALRVLVSPTVQNQLTAIPAPGATATFALLGLLAARRRR